MLQKMLATQAFCANEYAREKEKEEKKNMTFFTKCHGLY